MVECQKCIRREIARILRNAYLVTVHIIIPTWERLQMRSYTGWLWKEGSQEECWVLVISIFLTRWSFNDKSLTFTLTFYLFSVCVLYFIFLRVHKNVKNRVYQKIMNGKKEYVIHSFCSLPSPLSSLFRGSRFLRDSCVDIIL